MNIISALILTIGVSLMPLELKIHDFANQERIPTKFTCDGQDKSPEMKWSGAPSNTRSFVLIVDDPDAPHGTWDHWIVYNIPQGSIGFNYGEGSLPLGAIEITNSFGKKSYGGPCPPPGKPHRYFFKLYALDKMLDLPSGATKQNLLDAMEGHVIDKAEVIGLYGR